MDFAAIICRRASDSCPMPGSERGHHCVECNTEVWLSPQGQQQRNALKLPIYCNKCGFAHADRLRKERCQITTVVNEAAQVQLHNRGRRN